jgi:hypothetical protein
MEAQDEIALLRAEIARIRKQLPEEDPEGGTDQTRRMVEGRVHATYRHLRDAKEKRVAFLIENRAQHIRIVRRQEQLFGSNSGFTVEQQEAAYAEFERNLAVMEDPKTGYKVQIEQLRAELAQLDKDHDAFSAAAHALSYRGRDAHLPEVLKVVPAWAREEAPKADE